MKWISTLILGGVVVFALALALVGVTTTLKCDTVANEASAWIACIKAAVTPRPPAPSIVTVAAPQNSTPTPTPTTLTTIASTAPSLSARAGEATPSIASPSLLPSLLSTSNQIDNPNKRFRFDDKTGSIKMSASATWTIASDVLTLAFDQAEIDYASIGCKWTKCDALSHIRLRLANAANEAALDDEKKEWLSDAIRLEPPIALGERRTLRTLRFEVPLVYGVQRERLSQASLPFVMPRLEIGAIAANGDHSMMALGVIRGLPFAAERVPKGRLPPCARSPSANEAMLWNCPVERDAAIAKLRAGQSMNVAQKHPLWHADVPPLQFAASVSDLSGTRALLAAGADPNQIDASGETALGMAVWRGDLSVAKALIDGDAQVNLARRFDNGTRIRTALHSAGYESDIAMARLLLARGADPLAQMETGWTPLVLALVAPFGTPLVEAMLNPKIDINAPTPFNTDTWAKQPASPFLIAVTYNSHRTVRALIARGADPKLPGPWGFPVGHFAAYYGHIETLEALRESGVDLLKPIAGARPHAGQTYLMHAVHGGRDNVIDYLVKLGADPAQKDANGRTAADHAIEYKRIVMAAKLKAGWTQ